MIGRGTKLRDPEPKDEVEEVLEVLRECDDPEYSDELWLARRVRESATATECMGILGYFDTERTIGSRYHFLPLQAQTSRASRPMVVNCHVTSDSAARSGQTFPTATLGQIMPTVSGRLLTGRTVLVLVYEACPFGDWERTIVLETLSRCLTS